MSTTTKPTLDESVKTLCDACGVTDPEPKIHTGYTTWQVNERTAIANPAFHFYHLPDEFHALMLNELGEAHPQHATTVSAIAAAKAGVHGADLLAHIQAQPDDNAIGHGPADGHADDDNAKAAE